MLSLICNAILHDCFKATPQLCDIALNIQNLRIDYTITSIIINYFSSKCKVLALVLIHNFLPHFLAKIDMTKDGF